MRIEVACSGWRSLEPGMMERLEERREKVLALAEGWFAETDGKEVWPQKVSKSVGGRAHTAW